MGSIAIYLICSFVNVFFHCVKSILLIKSTKFIASLSNCFCYTFSAVVIKFIAETDMVTALCVQAFTNFFGCYVAMVFCEKIGKKNNQ